MFYEWKRYVDAEMFRREALGIFIYFIHIYLFPILC